VIFEETGNPVLSKRVILPQHARKMYFCVIFEKNRRKPNTEDQIWPETGNLNDL